MATDLQTVVFICDQAGLGHRLTHRKMFGEYALYCDGKVVALICDNQFYLKPTAAGRTLLRRATEAPPYPGARMHPRLSDELDDGPHLRALILATVVELPAAKPKKADAASQNRRPAQGGASKSVRSRA